MHVYIRIRIQIPTRIWNSGRLDCVIFFHLTGPRLILDVPTRHSACKIMRTLYEITRKYYCFVAIDKLAVKGQTECRQSRRICQCDLRVQRTILFFPFMIFIIFFFKIRRHIILLRVWYPVHVINAPFVVIYIWRVATAVGDLTCAKFLINANNRYRQWDIIRCIGSTALLQYRNIMYVFW